MRPKPCLTTPNRTKGTMSYLSFSHRQASTRTDTPQPGDHMPTLASFYIPTVPTVKHQDTSSPFHCLNRSRQELSRWENEPCTMKLFSDILDFRRRFGSLALCEGQGCGCGIGERGRPTEMKFVGSFDTISQVCLPV